jgi:hypothetical protein
MSDKRELNNETRANHRSTCHLPWQRLFRKLPRSRRYPENVGMASVQNVRRMKYVQTALSKPTQAM